MPLYVTLYFGLIAVLAAAWIMLLRSRRAAPDTQVVAPPKQLRHRLLRGLATALRNGEVYLVYQPKLNLRTGAIDGVEALVRWEHPVYGTISRKSLIPLAEERGRMRELTIWVLRQALADQASLAARGVTLAVAVNVSASLLTDLDFVRDACALAGPATGAIGLEITETALIENSPIAHSNLERLIEHGVVVSIDDYGSGLSSLAYLKELPAKELKIDKMFVSGMTMSHRDPLIVRSTIDLAHALGLTVVAEGVESLAVLTLLKVMGCDHAQGYLISPALPIAQLSAYLAARDYEDLLVEATAGVTPPTAFWRRIRRDEHETSDARQRAAGRP